MTTTDPDTNRDGIPVRPGQIWESLDKRDSKRRVVVEIVRNGYAYVRQYYGELKSRIKISRLHEHSTGYRLVECAELQYGTRRNENDEKEA